MSEIPCMIIDCSVLKEIFSERKKSKALITKIKLLNKKGINVIAFTTQSSFLRAIMLSKSDTKIKSLQEVLEIIEILPSFSNFLDDKAVTDEILYLANTMGKLGRGKDGRK